ncbi:nucleoside triphosphate pyrophosphohydrolase [Clostridium subterminale]|uniref:Nucleoside triphosphate pyrophosphohydrolase n=1 Tax=Clostridium subterminale TaxID=1550 RepID=A0ABP3W3L2_CLOSU
MKVYNKLVRDKIPQVIAEDGNQCDIEIASKEDMTSLLEDKLKEEVNEYLKDKNLEELADIMEVLFGLAHNLGYSEEELLEKRKWKLKQRGGFKDGVVLKAVK